MSSQTATGACLCGAFRYEFDRAAVLSAAHCHCSDCRRATGSGKATIVSVPTAALRSRGELKVFQVTGSAGSHVNRAFCPTCGSQLISYVDEMPDVRFVKAGTLDDASWVSPVTSFWASSAQPWSPVDASIPCSAGNPVP